MLLVESNGEEGQIYQPGVIICPTGQVDASWVIIRVSQEVFNWTGFDHEVDGGTCTRHRKEYMLIPHLN